MSIHLTAPSLLAEIVGEPVAVLGILPLAADDGAAVDELVVPERIHEISRQLYFDFLLITTPTILGATYFVNSRGSAPLQVFWEQDGRYFARLLTYDQSRRVVTSLGIG